MQAPVADSQYLDGIDRATPTPASGHRAMTATELTESLWPSSVCVHSPVAISQIVTVRSTGSRRQPAAIGRDCGRH